MKVLFCVWMILMLFVPPGIAEKQMRLTFVGDVTLGSEEYLREKDFSLVSYAERKGYAYFLDVDNMRYAWCDKCIARIDDTEIEESDVSVDILFEGCVK